MDYRELVRQEREAFLCSKAAAIPSDPPPTSDSGNLAKGDKRNYQEFPGLKSSEAYYAMDYKALIFRERKIASAAVRSNSSNDPVSTGLVINIKDNSSNNNNNNDQQTEMQPIISFHDTEPCAHELSLIAGDGSTGSSMDAATTDHFSAFSVGIVPRIFYIPNIIDPEHEVYLEERINSHTEMWRQMKSRRLQCWGQSPSGDVNEATLMPVWLQSIIDRMVQVGIFDETEKPNNVLINQYQPNEGILHHTDGPRYSGTVAVISVGSECELTFRHKLKSHEIGVKYGGDVFSVLLERKSLLIFKDEAYHLYMHGIDLPLETPPGYPSTTDGSKRLVLVQDAQPLQQAQQRQHTVINSATCPCINSHLLAGLTGVEDNNFRGPFTFRRGVRTSLTFRRIVLDK